MLQVTLQDLGNIGEFVGAIGVIATLIYLAVQIRQSSRQLSENTNSVQGGVELENARLSSDWLATIAQNPQLARVWRDSRIPTSARDDTEPHDDVLSAVWPKPPTS